MTSKTICLSFTGFIVTFDNFKGNEKEKQNHHTYCRPIKDGKSRTFSVRSIPSATEVVFLVVYKISREKRIDKPKLPLKWI